MCWINNMATPIVLKKPLKVYKVGKSTSLGSFISAYRNCIYNKYNIMPTVEINPEFTKYYTFSSLNKCCMDNLFCIYEGYHSYLTKKMAKHRRDLYEEIGIFEIPSGATIYVSYRYEEVVSTDIRYLGLLE